MCVFTKPLLPSPRPRSSPGPVPAPTPPPATPPPGAAPSAFAAGLTKEICGFCQRPNHHEFRYWKKHPEQAPDQSVRKPGELARPYWVCLVVRPPALAECVTPPSIFIF
jgi:hypothetical protein